MEKLLSKYYMAVNFSCKAGINSIHMSADGYLSLQRSTEFKIRKL
ncbi:MAG: hypothetical protein ACLUAF_16320 [Paraclostridium sordellii]